MLKLRRLKVEKFRSLAKATELSFSDGINLVLGQNGTGKTTLLELISMVVRSDFSGLVNEELAVEYEIGTTTEPGSLIVVLRNERAEATHLSMPFELGAQDLGARDIYRPTAEVLNGGDRRVLAHFDPERGLVLGEEQIFGPIPSRSMLTPAFIALLIGAVGSLEPRAKLNPLRARAAHRFDESLDLHRRITSTVETVGAIFVDPQRRARANSLDWLLLPNDLVKQISSVFDPRQADYSFADKALPFLAALNELMGFASSDLRVDVTSRGRNDQGAESIGLRNLLFRFRWQDGTLITHDRLSYGQKRLLTFFYYLASNPDIVIADELVNGLHHRWITASIEAMGERQAFLTSQNPLLFDYVPIPSADEVQKSFVLCRGEPREGSPAWIWENMSREDARELYSAYEVGVEHVSEILQSRGLW